MQLNKKSLEKLREIINGDDTGFYKTGYQLVQFFNQLGFDDVYENPFPSRWQYTDEKLSALNGTDGLWECIKLKFAVIDYVECLDVLDAQIAEFNKYLAFDKLKLIRTQDIISLKELPAVIIDDTDESEGEQQFLQRTFNIDLEALCFENDLRNIIERRIEEIRTCTENGAFLSAVIMAGSVMEAVLLGTAMKYPRLFNQAANAPKKDGAVKKFRDWSLANFIDVSHEIGIIGLDVKKFGHALRDFRNLIHPNEQLTVGYYPGNGTARISFQVLKAAIEQIGEFNLAHAEGE